MHEEMIRLVKNQIGTGYELKPCPFCGSKEIVYEEYAHKAGNRWAVWCTNCLGSMDTGCSQSMGQAQDMWNGRVYES